MTSWHSAAHLPVLSARGRTGRPHHAWTADTGWVLQYTALAYALALATCNWLRGASQPLLLLSPGHPAI